MRTGLKVLGGLTAMAAVGCIAKGNVGGFLGMVIFAVISFWRSSCKASNDGFEFLGFLCAFFASGGMIMVAQHGSQFPYPLILICSIILAVVFFVLCDRKNDEPKTNVSTDKPMTNDSTYEPKPAPSQPKSAKLVDYQYWNESIYNRLKRLCNPANFVDNYDKEKIDIANSIYSKLMDTNPDDNEAINKLVIVSEDELKINLLDRRSFDILKSKLNPKNFMEPYDSEMVTLSNELFQKIIQPDLNLTKYRKIEEQSTPLLEYLSKHDIIIFLRKH